MVAGSKPGQRGFCSNSKKKFQIFDKHLPTELKIPPQLSAVSLIQNFFLIAFSKNILTWRGRGSCSPKRVINKARRLIDYTALHAAVCGRLWLQLRLYVRRRIFARVELCACRRLRTNQVKKEKKRCKMRTMRTL